MESNIIHGIILNHLAAGETVIMDQDGASAYVSHQGWIVILDQDEVKGVSLESVYEYLRNELGEADADVLITCFTDEKNDKR